MGACCSRPTVAAEVIRVSSTTNSPVKGGPVRISGGLKAHKQSPLHAGADQHLTANAQPVADKDSPYDVLKSTSAVKVAVMVRPILDFEKSQGREGGIVTVLPPSKLTVLPPHSAPGETGHNFTFDRVYRSTSTEAMTALQREMVEALMDKYCQGFNATILAYGQTGSGKTYTMGTASTLNNIMAVSPTAVIPYVVQKLYSHMSQVDKDYEVCLKMSYVEIYNEAIQDLLAARPHCPSPSPRPNPSPPGRPISPMITSQGSPPLLPGTPIAIRETGEGEIVLDGVTEHRVKAREQLARLLEEGNSHRAVAAHKMNQESSRSHAIVTLSLEQRARPNTSVPANLRYLRAKLHLVDLAGSERVKDTGTTGQRFQEGVHINKGLLELGNVVNALTEGEGRRHIPYRNSKLTRLLQDSLGGNSETLFLACVSPAESNHDHTISTLRYASRAMKICNNLQINNQLSPEEEIAFLRKIVEELQAENAVLKAKLSG